jgi:tight adherence protein C
VLISLIAGLLFSAIAVALVARAIAMPRVRAAETVAQIGAYGFGGRLVEAKEGAVRGILDDLASALGAMVANRLSGLREDELRLQLMAAGLYRTPPRKFLGYRVLAAMCVPAAWVWISPTIGFSGPLVVLGLVCAVLAGWTAPMVIVRKRGARRLDEIDYELPELIDLLVVTVEAGLGFNGSLQVAAARMEGPLGDELRLTLQEQSMGLAPAEALKNMLARVETPAMRSFVRAVLQGEALGVSIGEIMRGLASEMRKRRRAAAEERAQKAPVKILFPLVFLMFPAMFIVLLGPAAQSFLKAFGG